MACMKTIHACKKILYWFKLKCTQQVNRPSCKQYDKELDCFHAMLFIWYETTQHAFSIRAFCIIEKFLLQYSKCVFFLSNFNLHNVIK